jgi:hypothetical protein
MEILQVILVKSVLTQTVRVAHLVQHVRHALIIRIFTIVSALLYALQKRTQAWMSIAREQGIYVCHVCSHVTNAETPPIAFHVRSGTYRKSLWVSA